MKLKLDENLGRKSATWLREAGHDVATVFEQQLVGSSDRPLIEVCRHERRGLVTLDLDFANTLLFPPSQYAGIVVLRLPYKPTYRAMQQAIQSLTSALRTKALEGQLWIVEGHRIREYRPRDPGE